MRAMSWHWHSGADVRSTLPNCLRWLPPWWRARSCQPRAGSTESSSGWKSKAMCMRGYNSVPTHTDLFHQINFIEIMMRGRVHLEANHLFANRCEAHRMGDLDERRFFMDDFLSAFIKFGTPGLNRRCLLSTSDAADDTSRLDLGCCGISTNTTYKHSD